MSNPLTDLAAHQLLFETLITVLDPNNTGLIPAMRRGVGIIGRDPGDMVTGSVGVITFAEAAARAETILDELAKRNADDPARLQ